MQKTRLDDPGQMHVLFDQACRSVVVVIPNNLRSMVTLPTLPEIDNKQKVFDYSHGSWNTHMAK